MADEEQSKYAEAGVDFNKEHAVIKIFQQMSEKTKGFTQDLLNLGITPSDDTGFFANGVILNLNELILHGYRRIGLLYGTDGAGTKPLAHQVKIKTEDPRNPIQKFELLDLEKNRSALSVGVDAVAMVANDLICAGARPMHISDYVAWQVPSTRVANDLASGLYHGAEQSMATVVGGENASLKEMIKGVPKISYDICVFGAGVILNQKILRSPLDGSQIQEGDHIIGLRSSGLHCNGISLARKTLITEDQLDWNGQYSPDEKVEEFEGRTAVEEILVPTTIYVKPILKLLNKYSQHIRGIVNISGEGIANLSRLLERTDGLGAKLSFDGNRKPPHPVFTKIQSLADVSTQEMYNNFNMGWGMYLVISKDADKLIVREMNDILDIELNGHELEPTILGTIVKADDHAITGTAYTGEELKF